MNDDEPLSMSMFATYADYLKAIEAAATPPEPPLSDHQVEAQDSMFQIPREI